MAFVLQGIDVLGSIFIKNFGKWLSFQKFGINHEMFCFHKKWPINFQKINWNTFFFFNLVPLKGYSLFFKLLAWNFSTKKNKKVNILYFCFLFKFHLPHSVIRNWIFAYDADSLPFKWFVIIFLSFFFCCNERNILFIF